MTLRASIKTPARRIRQAFLVLALPIISAPGWAATYYVATTGNDSNAGTTLTAPLKTISKAVSKVVAGDTVYVRGGTYREFVKIPGTGGTASAPIKILNYSGETPVIKGSQVVTGWTKHSGNIWKKTAWNVASQQVFVDFDKNPTHSLQQLGHPGSSYTTFHYPSGLPGGVANMKAGSFWYDAGGKNLYVWLRDGSDPNQHTMEVSTQRLLFSMSQAQYIYLKGFAFRHTSSSNIAQQTSAVEMSSNSTVEAIDIQYVDFAGLSMGYQASNTTARNVNTSNNGDSGINAPASWNFKIINAKMNGNNTRNFNPLWHAGGFKAAADAYGMIENSEASNNLASGIWFDYCDGGKPIVIRNNYIANNGPKEAGIFLEVTDNALVYNNVLVNNTRRGLYLSATDNVRFFNNTIVNQKGRSAIELAGMPRDNHTLTNNKVTNNIVVNGTSEYDFFFMTPNGTSITGNASNHNVIYRSSGAIKMTMGSTNYAGLAAWRTGTKNDLSSLNVNPMFVGGSGAGAYALASGSPAIDKGFNVGTAVPNDYNLAARPAGAGFDIGAFEGASSGGTTVSSTEPTSPTTSPTEPTSPTSPTTSPTEPTSPPTTATRDTTPPVVKIDPMTAITGSNGSFTLSGSATDNVGVVVMRLYVDGSLKATSNGGRISYVWNTQGLREGTHDMRISADDAAGNWSAATGKMTVNFSGTAGVSESAPTTTEPSMATE
jgi:parallel beta-helix repeat protein